MSQLIKETVKKLNIDWSNHLITFIATLLGILVAFQLDDWNNTRRQDEAIRAAIGSLKSELEANFRIINDNLGRLPNFTGLNGAILKFRVSEIPDDLNVTLVCNRSQFDSLRSIYPDRIKEESVVRRKNSKVEFQAPWDGFFPERLNFDNWDAVKSSGILYAFRHDQTIAFNRVYSHLQRNTAGVNEDDIVLMQVQDKKLDPDLFNETVGSFRFANEMKIRFTESDYKSIQSY
jgi:hypothetical protein